jgi:hypothetical protein
VSEKDSDWTNRRLMTMKLYTESKFTHSACTGDLPFMCVACGLMVFVCALAQPLMGACPQCGRGGFGPPLVPPSS